MKKIIILFSFLVFALQGKALEISLDAYTFKNEESTYLEAYLRVIASSVTFEKDANGAHAGSVDITVMIYQNEQIVTFDKYTLNAPTGSEKKDFLDVKRFALQPGQYELRLEAIDTRDIENKLEISKYITVGSYSNSVNLSDIQLLASVKAALPSDPLAKNGVAMEPITYGYANQNLDLLHLYAEAYTEVIEDKPLLVRYAIHDGYKSDNGKSLLQKFKKLDSKATNYLLFNLPIDELASGNYHAVIEIIDRTKKPIVSKKVDFIRSNPDFDKKYWSSYNSPGNYDFVDLLDSESLDYSLKAIAPIATGRFKNLLDFIIKDAKPNAKRKFLQQFWKEESPRSPQLGYDQYMKVVRVVDLEFANNVGHGFQTDKGHMFLKYGKPNETISIDTEPDAPPYEIWYYHELEATGQSNVRFLFYNPSLAHNDYVLLHSTCRGERQNPAWEVELYRDAQNSQIGTTIDATEVQEGWNRQAKTYFNDY